MGYGKFVDRRWLDVRINRRINKVHQENQIRQQQADEKEKLMRARPSERASGADQAATESEKGRDE